MEGGTERKADGWTDMEMQKATLVNLQTLLKYLIFKLLINYA